MNLTNSDWIAIAAVVVTILAVPATWWLTNLSNRKSLSRSELGYRMRLKPLFDMQNVQSSRRDLTIMFRNELLDEPVLLSVDIVNLGTRAIELPPIIVEAVGTTYVIPINIEDIPKGYEDLWTLERTDGDQCSIRVEHINPGQVLKARFFLDELPDAMPVFKCAMKDLKVVDLKSVDMTPLALEVLKFVSPISYRIVNSLKEYSQ